MSADETKDHKSQPDEGFEATLPMAGKPAQGAGGPAQDDLDLGVDDIQTRLPYGSEDIADK